MSLADIAAIGSGGGHFGGGLAGAGLGFIGGLILATIFRGGNGIFGGGFNNAIGYENLATSNELQRGFDNQNAMANQREILGAVTAGTAQSVAATNQAFHDNLNVIQDKYGELTRDIYGVSGQVAQVLANQNACCCDTKMLIQETSAQNRYDALANTNALQATIVAENQKTRDLMAQNKIESLQSKVQALELAQATNNVVRYPNGWTYNAGPSPFCGGCSCGCGF